MDKNLTIGCYKGLTSVKEHIQVKNEEMETYSMQKETKDKQGKICLCQTKEALIQRA